MLLNELMLFTTRNLFGLNYVFNAEDTHIHFKDWEDEVNNFFVNIEKKKKQLFALITHIAFL